MRVSEAIKNDSGCYLFSSYLNDELEAIPGAPGCSAPIFRWNINKTRGSGKDIKGLNKILITPFEALHHILPLYMEGFSAEEIFYYFEPYFTFKSQVTVNVVKTFVKAFDNGKLIYWLKKQETLTYGEYEEFRNLAIAFIRKYGDKMRVNYGFKI